VIIVVDTMTEGSHTVVPRPEGHPMPFTTRLLAAGLTGIVLAGALSAPALAAAAPPAGSAVGPPTARTSAVEARRVDRVKTPKISWYKCYVWAQCATVKVPLDYDRPTGATTSLALLRVKARNPKTRIGSLFVNPGGPGGSAAVMALSAPLFLSDSLLDRFDVVGMDPRGVGFSSTPRCFTSTRNQTLALAGLEPVFPYGKKEEAAYVKSVRALGRACSSTGKTLAGAMSTGEVARDMDVMRRAVGDRKLTYLGFSYGSALGQYYANMFPDRFRALAVDGVINPVSWVGTSTTANTVQDDRMHSADGAYEALRELFTRCRTAGPTYCHFAAEGDPATTFATIAQRLKAKPITLPALAGLPAMKITYADFIGEILSGLYSPSAGEIFDLVATGTWTLLADPATVPAPELDAAKTAMARQFTRTRARPGRDFPYDPAGETESAVMCTDGRHPRDASGWPAASARADTRAPYFGRLWAWVSAPCAADTWTVRDEDAYRGPFNRRTAATVLVVGSYWDPATNYREAVAAARLLPNSRLLSSDNWGHTAYGTGACATAAVDDYLLRGTLPPAGTVCAGESRPFTEAVGEDPATPGDEIPADAGSDPEAGMSRLAAQGPPVAGTPKQLPPVDGRPPTG
jgi:pimeloyl-ACP methyl ester carboxylesterase